LRGGNAGAGAVDHVFAFGHLNRRAAGARELLNPLNHKVHHADQIERQFDDFGLRFDDLKQNGAGWHNATVRRCWIVCHFWAVFICRLRLRGHFQSILVNAAPLRAKVYNSTLQAAGKRFHCEPREKSC